MLILLWILLPLLVTISDGTSSPTLSARSGEAVVLPFIPQRAKIKDAVDFKWTHEHLSVSWKNSGKKCHQGRCEVLSNGSLSFSQVLLEDVGEYRLEVFDKDGKQLMRQEFLLTVDGGSRKSPVVALLLSCLLLPLLLLLLVALFILRKRIRLRLRRRPAAMANHDNRSPTCSKEENIYVQMHSFQDNKGKGAAEKQKQVEEPVYVPHHPTVSMDAEESDIYV